MIAYAGFGVVDTAALPEYPLGRDVRLDGNSFVKWNSSRWLNSTMFLLADYEVQGVARALFDITQFQTPIGTLPTNDLELSRLLHLPLDHWLALRNRDIGPLHNWQQCLSGDERRWMHLVVLEVLQDAIMRRETYELSKAERAEAARIERLQSGLSAIGCDAALTDDFVLMNRINEWLTQNCKGRRTPNVYRTALRHAVDARWCERPFKLL
jgi:hypothetical protein